jgi:hypothetical protein
MIFRSPPTLARDNYEISEGISLRRTILRTNARTSFLPIIIIINNNNNPREIIRTANLTFIAEYPDASRINRRSRTDRSAFADGR